jgi:nicotinamidase-related amidase
MRLRRRDRVLGFDEEGFRAWQIREEVLERSPKNIGIILCDVWDRHWCRGANERLNKLLPQMARTVSSAREKGVRIIHAPSDTIDFYEGTSARARIRAIPHTVLPPEIRRDDPPLPIDASDGGPDTRDNPGAVNQRLWTRLHPAIKIDQERDVISDDGEEIFSYLRHFGVDSVIIIGVHTNMCVLGRSFAIRQMVRWGQDIMLCRDLTDAMYNPAMPPYVSHERGTELVIEYIEKFWCPSIESVDLA